MDGSAVASVGAMTPHEEHTEQHREHVEAERPHLDLEREPNASFQDSGGVAA